MCLLQNMNVRNNIDITLSKFNSSSKSIEYHGLRSLAETNDFDGSLLSLFSNTLNGYVIDFISNDEAVTIEIPEMDKALKIITFFENFHTLIFTCSNTFGISYTNLSI